MSEQRNREESAIRYLLGGLSENERASLEARFFADDGEFEELEIAEGELIDRYVQKELSPADQRQFEKMLRTSPRLVERVEFARILARRVPSPAPVANLKKNEVEKRPWWSLFGPTPVLAPAMRVALVAPMVLLLVIGVALALVWTRLQTQSERLAAEQQRLQQLEAQIAEQRSKNEKLATDLTQSNQQKQEQDKLLADYEQQLEALRRPSSLPTLSFLLSPGIGTRGGGSSEKTVRIPSGARYIELRLNVDSGNYSLYQASVQDLDRKTVVPQRKLKPVRRDGRKVLPLTVPVGRLSPGKSYIIHVDGLLATGEPEDFNDYPFRVTK